ncbi:MAG: methylated-DNA--[protein]-cysteine S-methyltransferase [Bacillota bacterium]|nr:methylated-DNA--[protein]-cysteine S-methyltransferase [Bacillota bacterium]
MFMSTSEYWTTYDSPVGLLTLCSNGLGLTALLFEKEITAKQRDHLCRKDDLKIFADTKDWLDRYFNGRKPDIEELELSPSGSDFAMSVWEMLRKIPYGKVVTYGYIAEEMAKLRGKKRMSAQAVGGAVGRNPISIILPCHRVIGAGGNLTGFGGGIDIKIKLLEHENVDMSGMYKPKKGRL